MEKIDKFLMKYFGWMLYPTDKQGKEEKHKQIRKKYDDLGTK